MSDDVAAPVKGIIKALETGIKLSKRVSRSASDGPPNLAYISELAQELQRNLEKSSEAISGAYKDATVSCGQAFAKALVEDDFVQNRLKEVRIDLIDQIDECQDFDENLNSFQPSAFTNVKQQSKRCRTECTFIFNNLRDRILETDRHDFRMEDKSPPLSPTTPFIDLSRRKFVANPMPSPSTPKAPLQNHRPVENRQPVRDPGNANPWSLSGPYFDHSAPKLLPATSSESQPRAASPPPRARFQLRDPSPSQLKLIPKEVVNLRINANDEFLERRRQSRIMFQELRHSFSSIEENRASEAFSDGSPWSSYSSASSPIERHSSRGSGYDDLIGRKRSQGQASQGGNSRNGSLRDATKPDNEFISPSSLKPPMSPGISEYQPSDSGNSVFIKSPVSPPTAELSTDNTQWGKLAPPATLASTLHVSGFAAGIEEGLEVVPVVESGLEVVPQPEPEPAPTPAAARAPTPAPVENRSVSRLDKHFTPSIKSIECPMRHDTSFYKFDGFCPGAKAMIRGETGFRVVKRPSGHYSATLSARCIKCSYEVGWNDVEKDRLLDRSGIYSNTGIRWRQRFISKCHLKTTSVDDPIYGCIFCIEEHRTVEEHDATVFFSVTSLFRHLARHPRPLPPVAGITTVYGIQPPSVLDFDIQFTVHEPKLSTYCMSEIRSEVLARPSAHAITTHHPKPTAKTYKDPDGSNSLHFADGAKIVGITFLERWGGQWCIGYHDGERGSFPANTIQLEAPSKDEVLMNPKSSVTATAKWEWKPSKVEKEAGWLRFARGERILCVGFTSQDQWCWSGCNSKGKWGLFPSSFVENLTSTDGSISGMKSGVGSSATGGKEKEGGRLGFGGLGSRMASFPLSRNRSTRVGPSASGQGSTIAGLVIGHRRAASVRSNGSTASTPSSPLASIQTGLDSLRPGTSESSSAGAGPGPGSSWLRG
ncbi:SH3 domain-containing protein [Rutstroemia sp. NJR-2017a BBW]|nr:SH3 domain-containing protein [Rutstroemia sp. NJR-2017a BBW]